MSADLQPGDGNPAAGAPSSVERVVDGWHVRVVQPYQATKEYRCPGCDHEVRPRAMHVVVWPVGSPGQRRHWHRPCWERRLVALRREAGRRRRR